jgi:hypothetical protein
MANQDAAFGFRPVGKVGGGVDTFAANASSTWIIVGLSKDPDNDDTSAANGNLIVKPNLHFYTGGKAGV